MKERFFNKKTLYYATTLFIALAVGVAGGIVDIMQTQPVVEAAQSLGYPLYFFVLLGVFKLLGAVALLLPVRFEQIKLIAYSGFAFDFIFASFSHYSVGDDIDKIATPLVMLCILGVSYFLSKRV